MSFLRKHYEKLILMVLLCMFVALFGYQVLKVLMESTMVSPEEEILNQVIRDNYTPLDLKDAKYDAAKAMQAGMKGEWKTKTGSSMDLLVPFPMIRCTIGRHLIPATDIEKRKPVCSYCNEDLTAATRTAAAAKTKKTIAIRDNDGDGIPDDWETKNKLNPKEKSDALADNDSDGFTNLEEYRFRTDPNNPKSRPSYAVKLYLKEVRQEQVGVRLKYFGMATPSKDPSKWNIQLEIRNPRNPSGRRKNISKKLGDRFETVNSAGKTEVFLLKSVKEKWVVDKKSKVKINQSLLEIVRISDKTSILVELQKEAIDPKQTVKLHFDVKFVRENNEISCTLGSYVTVGNSLVGRDTFLIQSVDMEAGTARITDKRTGRISILKPFTQKDPAQGQGEEMGGRGDREVRPQAAPQGRRRRGGLPQF